MSNNFISPFLNYFDLTLYFRDCQLPTVHVLCSDSCVRSMCLPQAQELPGIKIFKFEGALFFASSDRFREQLLQRTGLSTLVESAKKSAAAAACAATGTASPSARRRGSDAAQASGASVAHSQQPSGYGSSSVPGAAGMNNSLTRRNRSASQTFEDNTSAFGQVNRPSINYYSKHDVSNVRHLVIDMSDCTYIDDAGSKGLNEVCTFTVLIKLLYYPLIKLYTHEFFSELKLVYIKYS